ncbi:MAG: DMT family transporter [Parachlamydiales bacterium]|jgi:drug/metabolite transporter (DMT)-like permease
MKNLNNSPFWNVFLFSLFWALQIFVAKLGFMQGAKPVTMVFQSAIVALVVLSIYVLPKHINNFKDLSKQVLISLLIANAIHFGLGGFFSNFGNALTSAVNAGFLVKFALVTTTILAWIFLKEKMTWVKFIAVMIMLFGNFLISTKGQTLVPQIGDMLIIGACFCWSVGNIMIKNTLKNHNVNSDVITFLRPVAGIPVLLIFLLLTPLYPGPVQKMFTVNLFDLTYFIYALGSGVFTALLWIYLNRTLKVASASYMTMMSMMVSVFVAVLALAFLGETMTASQVIGAILTISAGVVTHYAGIAKG